MTTEPKPTAKAPTIKIDNVAIPDKDIPAHLRKEDYLEPQTDVTGAEPVQAVIWTAENVEPLIKMGAAFLKTYSTGAQKVLEDKAHYLADATAPVLNKYVGTMGGWAVEINCAIAWSMVGLEIYSIIAKEKKQRGDAIDNGGTQTIIKPTFNGNVPFIPGNQTFQAPDSP